MKIFCDFDGTIVDVESRNYRVYKETVEKNNGIALEQADYWDLKRKKINWPILLEKSGLSPNIEKIFLENFIKKIEDPSYLNSDTLFPGAYETLEVLAKNNQLYLVSLRRNEANLHAELEGLGIKHFFHKILSGHSETDGYDKKIELIEKQMNDEEGLIIGDTEADIVTGKKIGLISVAVTSGIRDKEFLANLEPDYLFESITELNRIIELN